MSTSNSENQIPEPDPSNPDFQTAVKALIDVYRPILEEDLKRAGDLEALGAEADRAPPDCDAEIAAAERLFGPFVNEKWQLHFCRRRRANCSVLRRAGATACWRCGVASSSAGCCAGGNAA